MLIYIFIFCNFLVGIDRSSFLNTSQLSCDWQWTYFRVSFLFLTIFEIAQVARFLQNQGLYVEVMVKNKQRFYSFFCVVWIIGHQKSKENRIIQPFISEVHASKILEKMQFCISNRAKHPKTFTQSLIFSSQISTFFKLFKKVRQARFDLIIFIIQQDEKAKLMNRFRKGINLQAKSHSQLKSRVQIQQITAQSLILSLQNKCYATMIIKSNVRAESITQDDASRFILSPRSIFDQESFNFPKISCQFIIILRQATLIWMEDSQKLNSQTQHENEQLRSDILDLAPLQAQEYKIISQYLSLRPRYIDFLDQQSHSIQICEPQTEEKESKTEYSTQIPANSEKIMKKTSDFHNFQKHLMTTLKKYIKMKRTTNSTRSKSSIACELWEYFLSNSKSSKREILCLLFGNNKNGESSLSKYTNIYDLMIDYFSQYTEKEIKSAQEYLCREIIRQSHKLLQSHSFQNRRINNTESFKNYFKIFISQLEQGKFSLRLPKCIKNSRQFPKDDLFFEEDQS